MGDTTGRPTVLVADDQTAIIGALELLLRSAGFSVESARSRDEILTRLAGRRYDALLMDLNYACDTTSGLEGLAIIAEVHRLDPLLPILSMTGWSTVETAVEAMRRGARAFIAKPWDNATLAETVRREIEEGRALRQAALTASRELTDAGRVQRALLPLSLPELPSCTMAAVWEPASQFGGDCYDAFMLGPSTAGVSIADVCGKGLPAALLMSNLQALVRALAEPHRAARDVVTRVNRLLCRNRPMGRFVTFVYLVLDCVRGTLAYTNAGHPPPLLLRTGGTMERLTHGGPVLGVFADAAYDQGELPLERGDRLVLFTDGVTEARDAEGAEIGEERLLAMARQCRHEPVDRMLGCILTEVRRLSGGTLEDDATLVAVGMDGRAGGSAV